MGSVPSRLWDTNWLGSRGAKTTSAPRPHMGPQGAEVVSISLMRSLKRIIILCGFVLAYQLTKS
ncbi:hypothetical protein U2A404210013 [Corynebacterium striatum]|nr:hypothetical protein U2A404210013 [Corynebacterium striatum]